MKKNHVFNVIAILLAITSLQSCAIFIGIDKAVNFTSQLDKVSVNGNEIPVTTPSNVFEQADITISTNNSKKTFYVNVYNNSAKPLFLVWDKVSLIYPDGTAATVYSGEKMMKDLDKTTLSLPIPAYSRVNLDFMPSKSINWNSGSSFWGYNDAGWEFHNIIDDSSRTRHREFLEHYQALIGQCFRIYLPLCDSNNNVVNEYMLFLKVSDVFLE